MKYFLVIILSCIAMIGYTHAQDGNRDNGQQPNFRGGSFTTTQIPRNWSIKREVQTIENSLENYDPLIQSLEEANSDLKLDLAAYLKNPKDQVLAAKITAKMSKYAKRIVSNVDTIISDQDILLSVFNELNQKLNKFSSYLDYKEKDLNSQVNKYKINGKDLRKKLKKLARKVKGTSEQKKQEQYKQEFRRIYNKFKLNERYKEGFARNQKDYSTLSKNLKSLVKMFRILHQAFGGLIENLEAEKKYLLDNIRLQADAIRVQKLVHEGISDGSRAVVKITKKLALLYAQVEGFAKVHEKINRDMAKFSDTTKILSSLVNQIETAPFQSAPTIDKAIDYFYNVQDEE